MCEVRMKIAVVGAGAVGSLVGGLLADGGEDVTLIGRSAHVQAIQEHGLHLEGAVGERIIRVKAQEQLTESPELTIFATKTQDLAETCRSVAPLVGEGPVITMQNGVRCDRIAREFFIPDQIVGCMVFCSATFLEPGRVSCQVRGWLTIGDPFVSQPSRLQKIKGILSKALPVHISRDIAATRWTKLITNLNNALPAVTGLPLQDIYFSKSTSQIPLRIMREGLETLSAARIRMDNSPQALAVRLATSLPESFPTAVLGALSHTRMGRQPMFGSTWQSIKRGSATEIDYLNGEIVDVGKKIGHDTPYNAHVVQLVQEVEKSGKFYPPEKLWPE